MANQLPLFQPLKGYLACGLTNLTPEQKQLVFQLSDQVSLICLEHGIELYEPRKTTDPVNNKDIQDTEVFRLDRYHVQESDVLIHLCHYPSTGSGIELDFALNTLIPVVLINHSDTKVSRMITGTPGLVRRVSYSEPEELREHFNQCLIEIIPILEQRRDLLAASDRTTVGQHVADRRRARGMSLEALAQAIPGMTAELLRQIEEHSDAVGNPSWIQLWAIARALDTDVLGLLGPEVAISADGPRPTHVRRDLSEVIHDTVDEWMTSAKAARYGGDGPLSLNDHNVVMREALQRVIENLGP